MLANRAVTDVESAGTRGFPPPPMIRIPESEWISGGEPVAVRMNDGSKISGALVEFRSDRGTVTLTPRNGAQRSLPLSDLKLIQIIVKGRWQPSQIDAELPGLQADEQEALAPAAREFAVAFSDGDSLKGQTLGFRTDHNGLYLFPLIEGDRFFCSFVPHGVIKSHNVGPLMGEMLVNEGVVQKEQLDQALKNQSSDREVPIGETLVSQAAVTSKELEHALSRQESNLREVRIGELLIGEGVITEDQLQQALSQQKEKRGKPIGEIMLEMKLLTRSELQRTLAKKLGIPSVDLRRFFVDPDVVKMVPKDIIRKHHIVPLYSFDHRLVIAMENPLDWAPIEAVSFATNMHVDPVIAPREEIRRVIDLALNTFHSEYERIDVDFSQYKEEIRDDALSENQYGDNMVVNLVNQIVGNAYKMGASDVHIEPNSKHETLVRMRRDGRMSTMLEVPPKLRRALVARIKVMAGLNITERRKPQDGRINLRQFTSMDVELRVATLPTVGDNEDVVMRILRKQSPVPVDGLDLSAPNESNIREALARTFGLFLVTGPTGSGKTTTLHSLLAHLNDGVQKIWTAEDPVEISQRGLRQLQINTAVGLDFASALRAFLRADPDIIMVGEMRDKETASVAVEASLTGHQVFSTLHTNTAPDTVARLLDMGMDPFNFSDALVGVLSQRLARRLCSECREPYEASEDVMHALADEYLYVHGKEVDQAKRARLREDVITSWQQNFTSHGTLLLYRAGKCKSCEDSGYRGRFAVHELMMNTPGTKRCIQTRAPTAELRTTALEEGLCTLRQDGIEKVIQGYTDLSEIRRVCAT